MSLVVAELASLSPLLLAVFIEGVILGGGQVLPIAIKNSSGQVMNESTFRTPSNAVNAYSL